jgi:hypothetical protein
MTNKMQLLVDIMEQCHGVDIKRVLFASCPASRGLDMTHHRQVIIRSYFIVVVGPEVSDTFIRSLRHKFRLSPGVVIMQEDTK